MSNFAIYQPEGAAGEYSPWACNLYVGCSNGCTYCYLKKGVQSGLLGGNLPTIKKTLGGNPATAKKRFDKELRKHKDAIIASGSGLFFNFTSDPCLFETIDLNMACISEAIAEGVPCTLLTKRADWINRPSFEQLINAVGLVKVQDLLTIGFTLTGRDDWEPHASPNLDRIEAMRMLHDAGFRTWSSCEPMIDCASTLRMIQLSHQYCDHYKIGLISGFKRPYTPDDVRLFVQSVLTIVPDERIYWKKSLTDYLK